MNVLALNPFDIQCFENGGYVSFAYETLAIYNIAVLLTPKITHDFGPNATVT